MRPSHTERRKDQAEKEERSPPPPNDELHCSNTQKLENGECSWDYSQKADKMSETNTKRVRIMDHGPEKTSVDKMEMRTRSMKERVKPRVVGMLAIPGIPKTRTVSVKQEVREGEDDSGSIDCSTQSDENCQINEPTVDLLARNRTDFESVASRTRNKTRVPTIKVEVYAAVETNQGPETRTRNKTRVSTTKVEEYGDVKTNQPYLFTSRRSSEEKKVVLSSRVVNTCEFEESPLRTLQNDGQNSSNVDIDSELEVKVVLPRRTLRSDTKASIKADFYSKNRNNDSKNKPIRRVLVRKPNLSIFNKTVGFWDFSQTTVAKSSACPQRLLTMEVIEKLDRLCKLIGEETKNSDEAEEHLFEFKAKMETMRGVELEGITIEFVQMKTQELLNVKIAIDYTLLDDYLGLNRKMRNNSEAQVIVAYMESYSTRPELKIIEGAVFNVPKIQSSPGRPSDSALETPSFAWNGSANFERFAACAINLYVPKVGSQRRRFLLNHSRSKEINSLRKMLCPAKSYLDGLKIAKCHDLFVKRIENLTEKEVLEIAYGFVNVRINELLSNGVNKRKDMLHLERYQELSRKKQSFATYAALAYVSSYFGDRDDFENVESSYFHYVYSNNHIF